MLFDGQRITEDQTAADLELEDGDALEVLLERKPNRLVETYSLGTGPMGYLLTSCRGWWVLGGIVGMLSSMLKCPSKVIGSQYFVVRENEMLSYRRNGGPFAVQRRVSARGTAYKLLVYLSFRTGLSVDINNRNISADQVHGN